MGLADGWRCAASLQWKARSAYTDYGKGSFGTAANILGVLQYKRRLVKTAKGQEVQVDISIQIPADYAIAAGDQISVDGGTTWKDVVAVDKRLDAAGQLDHYEVYA